MARITKELEFALREIARTSLLAGMLLGPAKQADSASKYSPDNQGTQPTVGCTIGPVSQIDQDLSLYKNPLWPDYYRPDGIHYNQGNNEYPSIDLPNLVGASNLFPEGGVVRWIGSDGTGTGKNGIVIEGLGDCSGIFYTIYHLDQLPSGKKADSTLSGSQILGNASCSGFEDDCGEKGSRIPPHLHVGAAFTDPARIPPELKTYEIKVNPSVFGQDRAYFVQILDLIKWAQENNHYLNMFETVWSAVHDASGTDQEALFVYGTIISESGGTYCPENGYWLTKYKNDGKAGYPNNQCVSSSGALGSAQFMPGTWKQQMNSNPDLTESDIFDPYASAQQAHALLKRIGVLDALNVNDEELAKRLFSATAPLDDKTRQYAVKTDRGLVLQGWNLGQTGYNQADKIFRFIENLGGIRPAAAGAVPKTASEPLVALSPTSILTDFTNWEELIDFAEQTHAVSSKKIVGLRNIFKDYPIHSAIAILTIISALTLSFHNTRNRRRSGAAIRGYLVAQVITSRRRKRKRR